MAASILRATLLVAIVTLIAGACGGTQPSNEGERVYAVKYHTVTPSIDAPGRQFPGVVQASNPVELAFRVGGPLIELSVTAAQELRQGDLIARIDPRDYQIRLDNTQSALSEARAQLTAMQTGARPEDVEIMRATMTAARATFEEAETQYQRLATLLEEDVGTQADVDRQRQRRDVAQAELRKAEQALKAATEGARAEDIAAMEARIAGLESQRQNALNALDDTMLIAPFDGVVAVVHVDNREIIQPNQPIVRYQDESALEIDIQVSEADMAIGPRYQTVDELRDLLNFEVEFAALPGERFPARLKDFETQADPQTQTFTATFLVSPPPGGAIRPGMNATLYGKPMEGVEINEQGYWVPVNAVYSDSSGDAQVWRIDPETERVSQVVVTLGAMRGNLVQALTGLEAGDTIAASAANSLQAGMKVRPFSVEEL